VTGSPIVHVQREQGADLFWRGASVVALFFIAVIVAVLIGVPVLLMVTFWNPWLLFTLVFAAAGILLLVRTVAAVRKMAWRARHRSSFVLREAGIETTEWNVVGADAPVRRVIPLEAVTSAVASYRIVRRTLLIENGGGTLTETAPILHVLFDQDGRRQITSVPFASHKDPAVDTWIEELRKRGVELRYTARLLSWKEEDYLSDEARLECFATTEEILPFPATGGWLENTTRMENRWHQLTEELGKPRATTPRRTRTSA
jgi:hypothetical protein